MSNQIINIKELSSWDKWLEVLNYSDNTYCNIADYLEAYKTGESLIKGSIDWNKIAETVAAGFPDEVQGSEIYLRLVEAHFNTTIKSGSQLWELTIDKDQNPKDKEGIDYSQFLIESSGFFRYQVYLYYLLDSGAIYKNLLQINPQDFGLPKDFKRKERIGSDQHNTILWAIGFAFNIGEPASLALLPDLRSIAQEIEAPYSVLMDSYKLFNK